MLKNSSGQWIAQSPLDLIGWDILVVHEYIEPNESNVFGAFLLDAANRATHETRTILADTIAVPVKSLEFHK